MVEVATQTESAILRERARSPGVLASSVISPDWLEQAWTDLLTVEAAAREKVHVDHGNHRRVFSDEYELVGLLGEAQFAKEYHQPLDLSLKIGGDPGYDFALPLRYMVNVKTYRRPLNLIHEEGKVVADIYVLAGVTDEPMRARLLGWEWGITLLRAPVRDFGYGVINHFIPAEALRPMEHLGRRIMHLR